MGVDRTDYIIFGFKTEPKVIKSYGINILDEKYLPYIEGQQGVKEIIVYDYMSGEYIVFGELISRAEDHNGVGFTKISFADFFDDEKTKKVKDKFIELFGEDLYWELDSQEPEVYVFSHYS